MKFALHSKQSTGWPLLFLTAITIVSLSPFVNKAFHIDDPLFIWTAHQIQANPADFYGFSVNWYGLKMPMHFVTKNPPLTSYYIALVAFLFGWSETVLHIAFFVPAIGVVTGSYFLARRLCKSPVLATLAGIMTPVYLLSNTTLMCDSMMLAFWVWAVFFWIRGMEEESSMFLFFSAICIGLSALTKYFGMNLIPLLLLYSLFKKRRFGTWMLFFLIPAGFLAAYQYGTDVLYGRGLISDAAAYATNVRMLMKTTFSAKAIISLAFSGGCLASVLFFIPLLWSRKVSGILACILIVSIILFPVLGKVGNFSLMTTHGVAWTFVFQFCIYSLAGLVILMLAFTDLRQHRDSLSLLLFTWVTGTFIFAGFINWTLNGRSLLPLVPAMGILLARRVEQRAEWRRKQTRYCMIPLMLSAALALFVTRADYRLADTARKASAQIVQGFGDKPGTIWFQGHWGFQYYMEQLGGQAIGKRKSRIRPGDILVIPSNNTNIKIDQKELYPDHTIELFPFPWLTTMHLSAGAGFYTDTWGPLPFVIGPVPPEKYYIFIMSEEKGK